MDVVGDVGGLYLDFVHVALVLDLETVHPRHRGFSVEHAVCIFTGGAEVLGHPFESLGDGQGVVCLGLGPGDIGADRTHVFPSRADSVAFPCWIECTDPSVAGRNTKVGNTR